MVFRPCFLPKSSRFRTSLRLILSADRKRNSWVDIQRYRASVRSLGYQWHIKLADSNCVNVFVGLTLIS